MIMFPDVSCSAWAKKPSESHFEFTAPLSNSKVRPLDAGGGRSFPLPSRLSVYTRSAVVQYSANVGCDMDGHPFWRCAIKSRGMPCYSLLQRKLPVVNYFLKKTADRLNAPQLVRSAAPCGGMRGNIEPLRRMAP